MTTPASQIRRASLTQRAKDFLTPGRRKGPGKSPSLRPVPEDGLLTSSSYLDSNGADGLSRGGNGGATGVQNTPAEVMDRKKHVRTLPPWIYSLDESEDLVPEPLPAHPPHHHWIPTPNQRAPAGRKFDRDRSSEPVIINRPFIETGAKWKTYWKASAYGNPPGETGQVVSEDWLRNDWPDLDKPWKTTLEQDEDEKVAGRWWFMTSRGRTRMREKGIRILVRNPFVPLILRLTVLMFVTAALALGAHIFQQSESLNNSPEEKEGVNKPPPGSNTDYVCEQQTSTYMAFIVDSIAILYLLYITWDEYTSKPLGLRRTRTKLFLLFGDLVFIVFSAANLSLAFNTLMDKQWSCYNSSGPNTANNQVASSTCVQNLPLCKNQAALCGVLTIALSAWSITYCISIARVIERVSR